MRRLLLLLLAGAASPLRAQMGPLGIPETRMGSGTSWLPDASPMHAAHYQFARWTLMLHGKGFLQYDWQGGSRGSKAVGPVAFPHRPSAADDPLAPISHHWQDGTHITFGVVTAGVFTRNVKFEASWFNGREPDEIRTNFDYAGRRLDSYSARLTVNPGPRWSLSTWYAYVKSPEGLHPDESLHRVGAAALITQPVGTGGTWSSALIYGANDQIGTGRLASSVLVESTVDLDGTNSLFGRVEYVQKSAEELVVASVPPTTEYDVGALVLGYLRTVGTVAGLAAGVGMRGSLNFVPSSLGGAYGSRTPLGAAIYLQLRPAGARAGEMKMHGMPGMHGGSHD